MIAPPKEIIDKYNRGEIEISEALTECGFGMVERLTIFEFMLIDAKRWHVVRWFWFAGGVVATLTIGIIAQVLG